MPPLTAFAMGTFLIVTVHLLTVSENKKAAFFACLNFTLPLRFTFVDPVQTYAFPVDAIALIIQSLAAGAGVYVYYTIQSFFNNKVNKIIQIYSYSFIIFLFALGINAYASGEWEYNNHLYRAYLLLLPITTFGFIAYAIKDCLQDLRNDLVERRRLLRVGASIAIVLQAFILAFWIMAGMTYQAEMAFGIDLPFSEWKMANALAISQWLTLLLCLTVCPLLVTPVGRAIFRIWDEPETVAATLADAGDDQLLSRLQLLIESERVYTRSTLTIGALAAMLDAREADLRRVINKGLGHRNFNQFLNGYRLEDAKRLLAEQGKSRLPILTIALDLGFGSAPSFNRVFKAATGETPSDFRERSEREQRKPSAAPTRRSTRLRPKPAGG